MGDERRKTEEGCLVERKIVDTGKPEGEERGE